MCLAVPLRLIEINGNDAVGEAMGMRRSLRVDFIPEPKIGDYVMPLSMRTSLVSLPRQRTG